MARAEKNLDSRASVSSGSDDDGFHSFSFNFVYFLLNREGWRRLLYIPRMNLRMTGLFVDDVYVCLEMTEGSFFGVLVRAADYFLYNHIYHHSLWELLRVPEFYVFSNHRYQATSKLP